MAGTTKLGGCVKAFAIELLDLFLLPFAYCAMQVLQSDSSNQEEDDEVVNLTKYILDKLVMVQPKAKEFKEDMLMFFARSIFFDREIEIEKMLCTTLGSKENMEKKFQ